MRNVTIDRPSWGNRERRGNPFSETEWNETMQEGNKERWPGRALSGAYGTGCQGRSLRMLVRLAHGED